MEPLLIDKGGTYCLAAALLSTGRFEDAVYPPISRVRQWIAGPFRKSLRLVL
jgi:hypothetical protein